MRDKMFVVAWVVVCCLAWLVAAPFGLVPKVQVRSVGLDEGDSPP